MKTIIKIYNGHVNNEELVLYGHVYQSKQSDSKDIITSKIKHSLSVINLFRVNPCENLDVTLKFKGESFKTKTLTDGFFCFKLPYKPDFDSGWHECSVSCEYDKQKIQERGEILKPYDSQFAIISDIDDTFLISHSDNLLKKLYVMLTKNLDNRKIFDGVAEHYKALNTSHQDSDQATNSFFYVSSSEWNLYDFIKSIIKKHDLPKGIIMLKKIKSRLIDFVSSGKGSHEHKFHKIEDIITFYPHLKFVLFGDDSQKDPYLYQKICKFFPENIKAVYIRQTSTKQKSKVQAVLENLENMNVSTCYFQNSNVAIKHSKKIGIVDL